MKVLILIYPEARVERSGPAITASQSFTDHLKLTCHSHSFLNTLSYACRSMPFLPRVSASSAITTLANREPFLINPFPSLVMPTRAKCKDNHNHFFQY